MKTSKVILCAIVILMALGCSENKSQNHQAEAPKSVSPKPEPKQDSEFGYYEQFIFDSEACSPTGKTYKYAASAYNSLLQSHPKNRLSVRLYLFRDYSYTVNFQIKSLNEATGKFETSMSYWRGGHWSIDQGDLILDGMGVGYQVSFDGVPAILIQIKDNYPGKMFDRSTVVLVGDAEPCQ
jgi:hypothetical protein